MKIMIRGFLLTVLVIAIASIIVIGMNELSKLNPWFWTIPLILVSSYALGKATED